MIISPSSLRDLYAGFQVSFNKGLKNTLTHWEKIAMHIPSQSAEENYSWLTDMPGIREWLGDRIVRYLAAARYVVTNKDFELTVGVPRNNIEDDKYNVYGPKMEMMGYEVARHPDKLVFELLKQGFSPLAYDGQYFFDTDHAGYTDTGAVVSVSNFDDGAGPTRYMFDCSQPIKPMIYQERRPFNFVSKTGSDDDNVFWQKTFIYGTDGRCNAGFGLWQLAFASKATLNGANFEAVVSRMQSQRNTSGRPMGVRPTHMVVPPSLEGNARKLISAALIDGGESNIWLRRIAWLTGMTETGVFRLFQRLDLTGDAPIKGEASLLQLSDDREEDAS